MTQSIATNANNDIFRDTSGNLALVSGLEAARQNCETAMKALQGEMMYAKQSGMPYSVTAWDNYRPKLFEAAARGVISAVTDVIAVLEFKQSLANGVLSYEATINTIYGIATFKSI